MTRPAVLVLRRRWWRRFHPLVRIGWLTATSGRSRTVTQTVLGVGMMGAGFYLRRSQKLSPIYTHVLDPGEAVRIRVYRGDAAMSEAIVKTHGP
ncbi:MAG: hypothetical protein BMS9Abin17_1035 [Acidimicrobiia bacterium]|nr:MAG: hypothetical protein BMS9Abin17_1035 [Acidimicrobiia bacterium]